MSYTLKDSGQTPVWIYSLKETVQRVTKHYVRYETDDIPFLLKYVLLLNCSDYPIVSGGISSILLTPLIHVANNDILTVDSRLDTVFTCTVDYNIQNPSIVICK